MKDMTTVIVMINMTAMITVVTITAVMIMVHQPIIQQIIIMVTSIMEMDIIPMPADYRLIRVNLILAHWHFIT